MHYYKVKIDYDLPAESKEDAVRRVGFLLTDNDDQVKYSPEVIQLLEEQDMYNLAEYASILVKREEIIPHPDTITMIVQSFLLAQEGRINEERARAITPIVMYLMDAQLEVKK